MSDNSLDDFLAQYNPQVQELTLLARALVLEVFPDALEQVDPPSKIIAYGFGIRYAQLVCALAPYQSYTNLIFSQGASLPDPYGLLEGSGKRARHVKIRSAEDVKNPALCALLATAVASLRPTRASS